MPKTIMELNTDTEQLIKQLRQIEVGQIISYKELSEIIGRDVQRSASGSLYSARRILQRDEEIVFNTIRNIGLERLNDVGVVGTISSSTKRIHRESERGLKRGACVQHYDRLPNDKKVEYNANMSNLGMLRLVTKPSKMRALETSVKKEQGKLSVGRTLAVFMDVHEA